jgi:hypothetical protein
MMKILILCSLILKLTVSNADCKSTSIAVYELTTAQITFNKLMLELYHPLTDNPTGEYAIFSAPAGKNFSLDALPGIKDFRISSSTINTLSNIKPITIIPINQNNSICSIAKIEQKPAFSKAQKTLCIPTLKVPNVMKLPNGNYIELQHEYLEVTMKMATTQQNVLKIQNIKKLPENICQ